MDMIRCSQCSFLFHPQYTGHMVCEACGANVVVETVLAAHGSVEKILPQLRHTERPTWSQMARREQRFCVQYGVEKRQEPHLIAHCGAWHVISTGLPMCGVCGKTWEKY